MAHNNNNARTIWTREEDKIFESALVEFPDKTPNRWDKIAALIPGKSAKEVEEHYNVLIEDIMDIEAGIIEPPKYRGDCLSTYDDLGEFDDIVQRLVDTNEKQEDLK
ncbi:hypothetical protein ACJIZ3_018065 [Penstemon smallii]|uniref:Myb-like domain-containing protein n=1 Tax=Penstemon smallii TaxID=265156 RepID=A0ABD3SYL6_9LAMI